MQRRFKRVLYGISDSDSDELTFKVKAVGIYRALEVVGEGIFDQTEIHPTEFEADNDDIFDEEGFVRVEKIAVD